MADLDRAIAWAREEEEGRRNLAVIRRAHGGDWVTPLADADHFAAMIAALEAQPKFDLVAHLERQREFSSRTFGPGARTAGVVDHIRRELVEVEAAPDDLTEWVDVVLLALDGAWRAGHSPLAIAQGIAAKQAKNEQRTWPDWRTADPNKAITHTKPAPPVEVPKS
jgi:hypothetical protein